LSDIGSNAHSAIDSHIGASAAHGVSGNVVGTSDAQTLTNKTIGDPTDGTKALTFSLGSATTAKTMTIASAHTDDRTITLPNITGTLATLAGTEELTNKTLTSATVKTDFSVSNAASVKFFEGTGGGTNYAAVKAPATLAGDYTLTLPADDGDAGQLLSTDGSGGLSWVSPLTNPMDSAGDLIVGGSAGAATKLDAGSDGQFLKAKGAASPEWTTLTSANVAGRTDGASPGSGILGEIAGAATITGSTATYGSGATTMATVTLNKGVYILMATGSIYLDTRPGSGIGGSKVDIYNGAAVVVEHVRGLYFGASAAAPDCVFSPYSLIAPVSVASDSTAFTLRTTCISVSGTPTSAVVGWDTQTNKFWAVRIA
jgi:hypothetical protein